ncbi:MAG: hypothetical protein A2V66_18250 [Ignavibacteria bacterium RBG_13_36_8]|nr:MAG: hypothetical protein A2V66_18250 [Ignavibacteria bacterium RBG_13_36_8]
MREGFEIHYSKAITKKRAGVISRDEINKLLSPGEISTEMYIKFSNYLRVSYTRELEDDEYRILSNRVRPPSFQISLIDLQADSVTIDIFGRYFDEFMIKTYGYWAFERLADTLPNEYSIEDFYANDY